MSKVSANDFELHEKLEFSKFFPLQGREKNYVDWKLIKVNIGVITKVEYEYQRFEIRGTKATIKITAHDEHEGWNDSNCKLLLYKIEKNQLQYLIGQEITNLVSEFCDLSDYPNLDIQKPSI